MNNKIRVNAEIEELRLSIPTDRGVIVVNNPKNYFKNDMIKYMVDCIIEDNELDEKRVMLDLIDHCTNVEFDMDIFEAVNLSHEAQMITNEILLIFQEIVGEASQVVKLVVQQAKNELEQIEVIDENHKILEELKKEEVKIEEGKVEVPRKVVKKPQRGRGKVVRK